MFQLDHEVRAWCRRVAHLSKNEAIQEELQDHLHCEIESLIEAGHSQRQAFLLATRQLGSFENLSREYAKTRPSKIKKHYIFGGWFSTVSIVHFVDFGLPDVSLTGYDKPSSELFVAVGFLALAMMCFRKAIRAGRPIID